MSHLGSGPASPPRRGTAAVDGAIALGLGGERQRHADAAGRHVPLTGSR